MNASFVQVDMEAVFFRLHLSSVRFFTQFLQPRARLVLEYLSFIFACFLLALLVSLHTKFVGQATCVTRLVKEANIMMNETHIIQLQISGFWTELKHEIEKETKELKVSPERKEYQSSRIPDGNQEPNTPLSDSLLRYIFGDNYMDVLKQEEEEIADQPITEDLEEISFKDDKLEYMDYWFEDSMYQFSLEKGFLLLSDKLKIVHLVNTANITLSSEDPCLGGSFQHILLENFVGYDTIVLNNFAQLYKTKGYVYNTQTQELWNLYWSYQFDTSHMGLDDILILKMSILITSVLVFIVATALVSITQREVQLRICQLILDLLYLIRSNLPYRTLIGSFIVQSITFIMISLGIFLTLAEFLGDRTLSLMLLAVVWWSELFTTVSVRTQISVKFFPKFFLMYFLLFHIYLFTYPFGFHYVAFFTMVAFIYHNMLYFYNHYEVPALLNGTISATTPRAGVVRRQLVVQRRRLNTGLENLGQSFGNQPGQPNIPRTIWPQPNVPNGNTTFSNQTPFQTSNNIRVNPFGTLQPTGLQVVLPQPNINPFGVHPNAVPNTTPPNYVFPQPQQTVTSETTVIENSDPQNTYQTLHQRQRQQQENPAD